MATVVVELREQKEQHVVRPGREVFQAGDQVLVSTSNGLETAKVIKPEHLSGRKNIEMKILRKLNDDDLRVLEENKVHSKNIFPDIFREIEQENLQLKLIKVSYTYDRQKLFVYYTAENRVDFRSLIRKLGSKLKVRIQMVQIGVRDEAALVGAMGICGRSVCCGNFLRNLESVNIEMARNQHISLNPENISGCCGRLLCCLRYENDFYEKVQKELPVQGTKVNMPAGRGEIIGVNFIKTTVQIKFKSGAIDEIPAEEIRKSGVKKKLKKWIKQDT